MKNYLYLFLAIATFTVFACNNENNKKNTQESDSVVSENTKQADIMQVTIQDFLDNAQNWVGEKVEITGTVDHVCKHGGKKMVIFDTNNDSLRVKIISDEVLPEDLIGSDVVVQGIVDKQEIVKEHEDETPQGEGEGKGDASLTHDGAANYLYIIKLEQYTQK